MLSLNLIPGKGVSENPRGGQLLWLKKYPVRKVSAWKGAILKPGIADRMKMEPGTAAQAPGIAKNTVAINNYIGWCQEEFIDGVEYDHSDCVPNFKDGTGTCER